MLHDETTTIDDVLREWDAGNPVWTVEMGGLGPGYEQRIQMAAMEILRDKKDSPLPEDGNSEAWRGWGDEAVNRLSRLGFSGAQVGAAKYIAAVFIGQGYHKGLEMAGKDRLIQVSKNFPQ